MSALVIICDDKPYIKDNPFFPASLIDPEKNTALDLKVKFITPENNQLVQYEYINDKHKWEKDGNFNIESFPDDSIILMDTLWLDSDSSGIIPALREKIMEKVNHIRGYKVIVYTGVSISDARNYHNKLKKAGYTVTSEAVAIPRSPAVSQIESLRNIFKAICAERLSDETKES